MASAKFCSLAFFLFIIAIDVDNTSCLNVAFTNSNWEDMLEGEWMVKFFAPWCPACRSVEETWDELGTWAEKNSHVSVGKVDITEQPALNGRFMVTSLPTIYHVKDGEFRQYSSSRSLADFKKFITEEEWKDIKPVSSWTSPSSSLMSGISKLFSLSMDLKNVHQSLSNEYGIPSWLSFVLFGLVVIVVGLLLGILLVIFTDWMWGEPAYLPSALHKKDDDAVDDKVNDSQIEGEAESIEEATEEEEEQQKVEGVRQRKEATEEEEEHQKVEGVRQRKEATEEEEEQQKVEGVRQRKVKTEDDKSGEKKDELTDGATE